MFRCRLSLIPVFLLLLGTAVAQTPPEQVFSGPQPGEKLVSFKALGVFENLSGKEFDPIELAGDKPLLLVFVHDPLTRPAAQLSRSFSLYGEKRQEKLATVIVFLSADRSQQAQYLRMVRSSLVSNIPVGVSLDGVEGPGAYGLNRNVALTVLIGKEGKVTSNFAVTQPALTEVPKMLAEAAKLIGEPPPTLEEVHPNPDRGMPREMADAARGNGIQIPRELLTPVINQNATPEQVRDAAAKVEAWLGDDQARKTALGRVSATIVNSGRLANYGTSEAQEIIKSWATRYGPPPARPAVEPGPPKPTTE